MGNMRNKYILEAVWFILALNLHLMPLLYSVTYWFTLIESVKLDYEFYFRSVLFVFLATASFHLTFYIVASIKIIK